MTRDQTPEHNTISIETLAARVARVVCRFLRVSSPLDISAILRETQTEAGLYRAVEHVSDLVCRPGWDH